VGGGAASLLFGARSGLHLFDAANTSNAVRLQAYADTMARVRRDHPGDTEVAIFYARLGYQRFLTLMSNADSRRSEVVTAEDFVR
jgi:hypothetical protein